MAVPANAARVSFQLRWRRDAARARAARGGLIDAAVSVACAPPPPPPPPPPAPPAGGGGEGGAQMEAAGPDGQQLQQHKAQLDSAVGQTQVAGARDAAAPLGEDAIAPSEAPGNVAA